MGGKRNTYGFSLMQFGLRINIRLHYKKCAPKKVLMSWSNVIWHNVKHSINRCLSAKKKLMAKLFDLESLRPKNLTKIIFIINRSLRKLNSNN
jgi:hypothetical protein